MGHNTPFPSTNENKKLKKKKQQISPTPKIIDLKHLKQKGQTNFVSINQMAE
jgi:hypothetical protein